MSKTQQWFRYYWVNALNLLDPFKATGNALAGTTLFDETPAEPAGVDSGRTFGAGYGVMRGVLRGFGR